MGHVYGVDHSEEMWRQASRRNRKAIRAGGVSLQVCSVDDLEPLPELVDVVLAVNNVGTWPEPPTQIRRLRGFLRPGGRLAVVSQPRCPGATASTTEDAARKLEELLRAAGYVDVTCRTLALSPPAACVVGTSPPHE